MWWPGTVEETCRSLELLLTTEALAEIPGPVAIPRSVEKQLPFVHIWPTSRPTTARRPVPPIRRPLRDVARPFPNRPV